LPPLKNRHRQAERHAVAPVVQLPVIARAAGRAAEVEARPECGRCDIDPGLGGFDLREGALLVRCLLHGLGKIHLRGRSDDWHFAGQTHCLRIVAPQHARKLRLRHAQSLLGLQRFETRLAQGGLRQKEGSFILSSALVAQLNEAQVLLAAAHDISAQNQCVARGSQRGECGLEIEAEARAGGTQICLGYRTIGARLRHAGLIAKTSEQVLASGERGAGIRSGRRGAARFEPGCAAGQCRQKAAAGTAFIHFGGAQVLARDAQVRVHRRGLTHALFPRQHLARRLRCGQYRQQPDECQKSGFAE